ncbi:hypothetical protein BC834DRAFT_612044 [Gloeopeniophorella convolvens]|nr:hypothetical protein BC834DRAFT_612044 [Gloeopeniophorella convolvens]
MPARSDFVRGFGLDIPRRSRKDKRASNRRMASTSWRRRPRRRTACSQRCRTSRQLAWTTHLTWGSMWTQTRTRTRTSRWRTPRSTASRPPHGAGCTRVSTFLSAPAAIATTVSISDPSGDPAAAIQQPRARLVVRPPAQRRPELTPACAFTFSLPPSVPMLPFLLPAPAAAPAEPESEPAHAQQGCEKCQRHESREDETSASASEGSTGRILRASTTPHSWYQPLDMTRGKFNPCASSPAWFLCVTGQDKQLHFCARSQLLYIVEDLATHSYTSEAFPSCSAAYRPRCIDRLNLVSYAYPDHRIVKLDKKVEGTLLQQLKHAIHVWRAESDRFVDDSEMQWDALPSR